MPPAARSEEEVTTILMGLVFWAGAVSPTIRYLKSEKGITISNATLADYKERYADRYDQLREKYQQQTEMNLAHEMRDVARLATLVAREAVEKTREQIAANKEKDPARAAANMATVAAKTTDKLMTLTARPQTITETRDASQILAKLVQMGVLKPPDEPKAIEGTVED